MALTDQEGKVGRWISILYRHAQVYIANRLKPHKIGSGQYGFLCALYKNDGVIQESLTEILHMDKATTARALAKLETEGYVQRIVDSKDKRALRLYVTDQAREIMPTIENAISDWNDLVTTGLEDAEKEIALKLLRKMAMNTCNIKEQ